MKTELSNTTNGADDAIALQHPYVVRVNIRGVADMLLHRWNAEAVDSKAAAKKNSREKKTDNIESYVYRDDDGFICIPGEYLKGAIVQAAKFKQDPRSPRKSARDLYQAGIISLTPLASLGLKTWDYEDRRRVMVQRQGINRTRPAIKAGWSLEVDFLINTPEYISLDEFIDTLNMAGRLIGIADFRPTYGRFTLGGYEVVKDYP